MEFSPASCYYLSLKCKYSRHLKKITPAIDIQDQRGMQTIRKVTGNIHVL
jgi:hypothetical protein